MKKGIIYSNNPMFMLNPPTGFKVEFISVPTALDVLYSARNQIHKNHLLLTHPLHSNIRPNDTPYRSVAVSYSAGSTIDLYSLDLIETAITVYEKHTQNSRNNLWSNSTLKDLQLIDYDLISNAIEE